VEGGRSFANQARMSASGPSADLGGAWLHPRRAAPYLPGLSDYVVLVHGTHQHLPGRPTLVKAAIGEDCTDDELGGAETHAQVTGLGEYLTEDDAHAIALTRDG